LYNFNLLVRKFNWLNSDLFSTFYPHVIYDISYVIIWLISIILAWSLVLFCIDKTSTNNKLHSNSGIKICVKIKYNVASVNVNVNVNVNIYVDLTHVIGTTPEAGV
jgi:hypothetical protein